MRKIGFSEVYRQEAEVLRSLAPLLLEFDSGAGISFMDALQHMLVTGTTGSGKTRGVMLPALKRHIEAGNCGFAVDIKGNLRGMVREMATAEGRENDVVEFGTSPSATPVNLLATMNASEFYDFCIALMHNSFGNHTDNMDFHVKGAGMAKDAFRLLDWMKDDIPALAPNMFIIMELFNDFTRATSLFQHFERNMANKEDVEQMEFIRSVKNSQFHILNQTRNSLADTLQAQQVAYCTHTMINTFKEFLDVPGIANFCAFGAPGIDMGKLMAQGKIVTLRCDPQSGTAGAHIGRHLLNKFYKCVFEEGVQYRNHQRFVFIDEFQEVADLGNGRFSDVNFIAQAREFGVGFMAATQSASALMNRGNSEVAMEAFVSNCNNKVFFFTDDLKTRAIAGRYSETDLIDLKPGEAFVVRYDAETRKHQWGMETLGKAYASVEGIGACAIAPAMVERPVRHCLSKIMDDHQISGRPVSYKPPQTKKPEIIDDSETRQEFLRMFPDLFFEGSSIHIPPGWKRLAMEALIIFDAMKFGIVIDDLSMNHYRKLYAVACKRDLGELRMLNQMLEKTQHMCVNCGCEIAAQDVDYFDDDNEVVCTPNTAICEKCKMELVKKFGVRS